MLKNRKLVKNVIKCRRESNTVKRVGKANVIKITWGGFLMKLIDHSMTWKSSRVTLVFLKTKRSLKRKSVAVASVASTL